MHITLYVVDLALGFVNFTLGMVHFSTFTSKNINAVVCLFYAVHILFRSVVQFHLFSEQAIKC